MMSMPWYGELPERWESANLRQVFQERKEKNTEAKCSNILSVMRNRGVIPYADKGNVGNKHSEDIERYSVVHIDDIVMNSMNVIIGSVGRSNFYGVLSPVYYVLYVINAERNNVMYLDYVFQTTILQRELTKYGNGILAHRMRIPMDKLKSVEFPLPPRDEQDQIVRYLDWKVSQINKLINVKRRQIALLQEQKQAVINKTVTKGVNPNTSMADSGFAWIGKIPDSWHIRPFSKIANVCSNLVHPVDNLDLPQVSPANIVKNTGRLLPCSTVREAGIISDNHRFYTGQILYSKIRPLLNKVTIAPFDGLCSADMYPVETKLITKYLVYFMLSETFLSQLTMTGNRVKMPKINQEELSRILILCPLDNEQHSIVVYLDEQCERIDRLVGKLNDEIALFTEYRTRLISDVVTGKLDVRCVIVPEYEAIDETVAEEISDDETVSETEE